MSARLQLTGGDRLLVLAVHPDDETLGAGGLLQQAVAAGAAVRVIFVTDGDNNPWPQRYLERRLRIGEQDRYRWGMRRRQEALDALQVLGVDPHHTSFFGFPDQGLTALLDRGDQTLIGRLCDEIARWKPTMLVSASMHDLHPDHNALAVLLDMALRRIPPEIASPKRLDYLIHRKPASMAAAWVAALSASQLACKRQAMLCHETQTALSRGRFMRQVAIHESYFGQPGDGRYQLFHAIQEVNVTDDGLHVRMRLPRWMRLLAQPELLVAATNGMRWRLRLDGRERCAEYADAEYDPIHAQVRIMRDRDMIEAMLPFALFVSAQDIYLKLQLRWGFFDHAGWRRAALHPQRTRAEVVGIIPCYNVERFCGQVVLHTMNFVDHLIVIDDGSTDGTGAILRKLAAAMPGRITLLDFAENRGKGVGLMAGFCEALNRFDFSALVTLDADGQHPPADIPRLAQTVQTGADMAIGERQIARMPGRSKFGNSFISAALRRLYAQAPTDTQSGMRAFSQAFAREVVGKVRGSRYETEFQVLLLALSQRRSIASVPIATIYIDNNRSSKYRPIADSVRILSALIRWQYGQYWHRAIRADR